MMKEQPQLHRLKLIQFIQSWKGRTDLPAQRSDNYQEILESHISFEFQMNLQVSTLIIIKDKGRTLHQYLAYR